MNWYAYVGNDPMNGVDPDGMEQKKAGIGTRIPGRTSVNSSEYGAKSNVNIGERQEWRVTGAPKLVEVGTVGESRDDINVTLDLATAGAGKILKEVNSWGSLRVRSCLLLDRDEFTFTVWYADVLPLSLIGLGKTQDLTLKDPHLPNNLNQYPTRVGQTLGCGTAAKPIQSRNYFAANRGKRCKPIFAGNKDLPIFSKL